MISPGPELSVVDDGLAYDSRHYEAKFGAGKVDFWANQELDGKRPHIRLEFEDLRIGDNSIAQGGPVQPEGMGHQVIYDRGVVREEYALGADGLEQSFIIAGLPGEAADCVVTCKVDTNATPPAGSVVAPRISFTSQDREVLFLSNAVVKDSSGRELALNLELEGGTIQMRVPAAWIAEASFPITIDPLVSGPIVVDSNSPTPWGRDVAFNVSSSEWLVAWSEFVSSQKKHDIFVRRVSSSGTLVGNAVNLLSINSDDLNPHLAYAPAPVGKFLLTWERALSGGASAAYGMLLNSDGSPASAEFQIAASGGVPYPTFDGNNWFVVYQDGTVVSGRTVSTSSSLGSIVQFDTGADIRGTQIAFTNNVFLIVWRKQGHVVARTMSSAYSLLTPITDVEPGSWIWSPEVAAGNGLFIISYGRRVPNGSLFDTWVYGRIANTSLSFTTPEFIMTSKTSTPNDPIPAVSGFSATNQEWYSVVRYPPVEVDLAGIRVSSSGGLSVLDRITNLSGYSNSGPRLALNPTANEFLIVYSRFNQGTSTDEVVAQRYTMNAVAAPANFSGTVQSTSSILWSWSNVEGESGYLLHDDAHTQIGPALGAEVLTTTEEGLTDNALVSRHIHATSTQGNSAPSNTTAKYTFIHNATTADFTLTVVSSSQINVVVTPPNNSSSGSTGVKIERQNGNKWTLLQNFASNYTFNDTGRSANTTYTYRITFQNGNGIVSAVSPTQSVATSAPAAPTGLAGVAQSSTSLLWTWNEVIGETGYNLYDTGNNLKGSTPANIHTFTETVGLLENSTYSRYVKAFNGVNSGPASATASKYTKARDAGLGDFTLVLGTVTRVDVAVAQPINFNVLSTGCEIQRSPDNSNWTIIKNFSNTYDHQDSGVSSGGTFYYKVRYQNAEGVVSAFSPSKSITVALIPIITTPSKKTKNQNTAIQGTGVVGSLVTVYFNGNPEAGSATVNGSGTWSYSVATKPEASYTVIARATLGGPPSSDSNSIQVTIDISAPPAPTNVRIAPYNNTIDVLWDSSPASDLAGYQISRKTGSGGSWSILNASQLILGNQYRDATAVNGQLYFYRVTAIDDAQSD